MSGRINGLAGSDLMNTGFKRFFWFVMLGMTMLTAGNAAAISRSRDIYTVRDDHGGYVLDYAIHMAKLERARQPVRFAGRCDSACTMLLGLRKSQTCITPSARFGFHLPFGSSREGNKVAARFLSGKYPGWVIHWLEANGGLNSRLKVMPYTYASQHMKTCEG